jgi:GTP cyclohydrolase I
VNLPAADPAVTDLLVTLGNNPTSERLLDTPRRVTRSFAELLAPRELALTTFPNDDCYDELVPAKSIPVRSLFEHHLLPSYGLAHVGYLPDERILEPSMRARIVELFTRNLQVQK